MFHLFKNTLTARPFITTNPTESPFTVFPTTYNLARIILIDDENRALRTAKRFKLGKLFLI